VSVELSLSDQYVDLVAEGFELAIRTGKLEDSSLVARTLATSSLVTVASPGYLAAHGHPAELAGLESHSGILDTNLRSGKMIFETPDGQVQVCPRARVAVNSPSAARDFALEGRGIAQVPLFVVHQQVRSRTLVTLFDHLPRPALPISAVYPERRHQSARARRYIEHCARTFAEWSG
jgi:DNA-binding transcriptional LysR family regulator